MTDDITDWKRLYWVYVDYQVREQRQIAAPHFAAPSKQATRDLTLPNPQPVRHRLQH
jgi:hypothetical protein